MKNENVIIDENYMVKRFNYSKADFEDAEDVRKKWDEFIRIYNSAVEKFVPREGARCRKGKEWFNTKCKEARNCKLNVWNRWKKRKTESRWEEILMLEISTLR